MLVTRNSSLKFSTLGLRFSFIQRFKVERERESSGVSAMRVLDAITLFNQLVAIPSVCINRTNKASMQERWKRSSGNNNNNNNNMRNWLLLSPDFRCTLLPCGADCCC
jgi:hypothetical protein